MSDKIYVQVGVKGRSLPAGGNSGDVLAKASENDFDLVWVAPAGGTSALIPSAAITVPKIDKDGGALGDQTTAFARGDHQHQLNVSSTLSDVKKDGTASLGTATTYARTDHIHGLNVPASGTPEDLGTAALGTATTYARSDHVHKKPTASEIATTGSTVQADINAITLNVISLSLETADWVTDANDDELHSQTVTITGGTSNTLVDLRPDKTVLKQMAEDGTLAIYVENSSGTFTAYALGDKPTVDLTVQATKVESITPS